MIDIEANRKWLEGVATYDKVEVTVKRNKAKPATTTEITVSGTTADANGVLGSVEGRDSKNKFWRFWAYEILKAETTFHSGSGKNEPFVSTEHSAKAESDEEADML